MLIWIFRKYTMKQNIFTTLLLCSVLCGCSFYDDEPQGQIVYHWAKENTGVQKFSKDHSECMREAEPTRWVQMYQAGFIPKKQNSISEPIGMPVREFGHLMFHTSVHSL